MAMTLPERRADFSGPLQRACRGFFKWVEESARIW